MIANRIKAGPTRPLIFFGVQIVVIYWSFWQFRVTFHKCSANKEILAIPQICIVKWKFLEFVCVFLIAGCYIPRGRSPCLARRGCSGVRRSITYHFTSVPFRRRSCRPWIEHISRFYQYDPRRFSLDTRSYVCVYDARSEKASGNATRRHSQVYMRHGNRAFRGLCKLVPFHHVLFAYSHAAHSCGVNGTERTVCIFTRRICQQRLIVTFAIHAVPFPETVPAGYFFPIVPIKAIFKSFPL